MRGMPSQHPHTWAIQPAPNPSLFVPCDVSGQDSQKEASEPKAKKSRIFFENFAEVSLPRSGVRAYAHSVTRAPPTASRPSGLRPQGTLPQVLRLSAPLVRQGCTPGGRASVGRGLLHALRFSPYPVQLGRGMDISEKRWCE